MTMWIVLFSFLMPPADGGFLQDGALRVGSPMRYHGVEKLIAKFEREAKRDAAVQR